MVHKTQVFSFITSPTQLITSTMAGDRYKGCRLPIAAQSIAWKHSIGFCFGEPMPVGRMKQVHKILAKATKF